MTVGVRRALTTATAVMSCSAVVVFSASPAQAAHGNGKGGGPGQQGWCGFGALSYSPDGQPPVVTTPNATALSGGTLSNTGGFDLDDVHAVLTVAPPSGTTVAGGSGAPLLAWRANGGSWESVGLAWNGISGPGAAWRSADLDLGFDLATHASASVDLETEFVAASPGGQYVEQLNLTAQTCGAQNLGAGLNFSDFEPAAVVAGSAPAATAAAKRTTAAAVAPVTSQAAPSRAQSTSAQPSATPSAAAAKPKPSPSASPLKITFVQVLPSAQSVASTSTGGGIIPAGVLAVVAVVFLGGLVCIRAVRRRDAP